MNRYYNDPKLETPKPAIESNDGWLLYTVGGILVMALVVVVLSFALRSDEKKPVVIKRAAEAKVPPPKPKRIFPWYVKNDINHKWAVVDSADIDNHNDTIWLFYGSMRRYENQLYKQTGYMSGYSSGGFIISSSGVIMGVGGEGDTTAAAPIGGEFQFSTLDSAKRMYKKYVAKCRREEFVIDSTKKRNDFITDSLFKREHTYRQLEDK